MDSMLYTGKYVQYGLRCVFGDQDHSIDEKFFNGALKKFGVGSPDELGDEAKAKFFNYIDKNWQGDNESD